MKSFNDSILNSMRRWHIPGVAIAVVTDQDVSMEYTAGVCNIDKKTPVTPYTRFAMASGTKPMTSALIGILEDKGILDYDTPIKTWIPEFKMYDPVTTDNITLRDILCHRSGLVGYDALWPSACSHKKFLEKLKYLVPAHPFRYQSQYSNIMYTAAGYIAECVAKTPWETLMKENIILPLGMEYSGFSALEMKKQDDFADGYLWNRDHFEQMPEWEMKGAEPAASLYSNLRDMEKWLQFQLGKGKYAGERILSEKNINQMHMPHMIRPSGPWVFDEFPDPGSYGLGWMIRIYRGQKLVFHVGEIEGFCSIQALVPEKKTGVVIMINRHGSCNGFLYAVLFEILDLLLEKKKSDCPWSDAMWEISCRCKEQVEKNNPAENNFSEIEMLHAYEGDYQNKAYGKVKISFDGANMFFMSDRGIYPIRYSGGEYYVENFKEDTFFRNIPIRFLRNQEDKKFDFYMKIESSADAARFENIQS